MRSTTLRPNRYKTKDGEQKAKTNKRRDDRQARLRGMLGADSQRRVAVKVTLPILNLPPMPVD